MPSERFLDIVNQYVKALGGMDAYRARRKKAQTDLWFLSKEIFRRDLFEKTHKPVVDFFLKKKPFAPAWKDGVRYTLADFQAFLGDLAPLEKRKGIRGCAGEAANHAAFADPANLFCVGLDHRVAQGHLSVPRNHHLTGFAHGKDRGAMPQCFAHRKDSGWGKREGRWPRDGTALNISTKGSP